MEEKGEKMQVLSVPVEQIIPNRFQPRINFEEKALTELANSITTHGILQPLVTRKIEDKYEIVAGERRYKAAIQAGLTNIPIIVKEMTDSESAEIALIENIQRQNLNSIEEAMAYQKIIDMGYTQGALAEKLGKDQSTIANKMRLLKLSSEVKDAVINKKISERHARSLLSIDDSNKQLEMLNKIIENRLTVRDTDKEIKEMLNTNIPDFNNLNNETEDEIVKIETPILEEKTNEHEDIIKEEEHEDIIKEVQLAPIDNLLKTEEDTEETPIEGDSGGKFFNDLENEEVTMEIKDEVELESKDKVPVVEVVLEPKEEVTIDIEKIIEIPEINIEKLPIEENVSSDLIDPKPEDVFDNEKKDLIEDIIPIQLPKEEESEESSNEIPAFEIPAIIEEKSEIKQEEIVPNKDTYQNNIQSLINEYNSQNKSEKIDEELKVVEKTEEDVIETNENNILEENKAQGMANNIKVGINTIRNSLKTLESNGFILESEELDFDDSYQFNIKIKKQAL